MHPSQDVQVTLASLSGHVPGPLLHSGTIMPSGTPLHPVNRPSVLVADDNELLRNGYAKALDLAGYEPLCAGGMAEALELVRRRRPRMALIDIFMDGRDIGYDLCRAVSEGSHLTDVFLMSSIMIEDKDRLRAYASGAASFLVKPNDLGVISSRIRGFLVEPRPLLQLNSNSNRARVGAQGAPVLVIDDDEASAQAVSLSLESEGFLPFVASAWSEAMMLAHKIRPSAIVLDMELPDVDGLGIMRMLRAHPSTRRTPILMLTGSGKKGLEIQCLRQGADDFLVKGVHDLTALPMRISRMLSTKSETSVLKKGALSIDSASRQVSVGRRRVIGLAPKEFELLTYLVQMSPDIASWEDIQRHIWHTSEEVIRLGRGTPTIAVHCDRLRGKLGSMGSCLIVHRGIGLQFDPAKAE